MQNNTKNFVLDKSRKLELPLIEVNPYELACLAIVAIDMVFAYVFSKK